MGNNRHFLTPDEAYEAEQELQAWREARWARKAEELGVPGNLKVGQHVVELETVNSNLNVKLGEVMLEREDLRHARRLQAESTAQISKHVTPIQADEPAIPVEPITLEQQIKNALTDLQHKAYRGPYPGKVEDFRSMASQLIEMFDKYTKGELLPVTNELPF